LRDEGPAPGRKSTLSHGEAVRIFHAETRDQLDCVRALFEEYAASLDFDLAFQDFAQELAELPGGYAPPTGRLLLAWQGDCAVGCVALRGLHDDICEMKRLYVRPAHRGAKIGLALAQAAIAEAKQIGYTCMRLDTVPSMGRAQALYRSLGFQEIGAYCHNPIPGATYLELKL
jgi:ribosomal protein S18 acetylase RimI-like enzyme